MRNKLWLSLIASVVISLGGMALVVLTGANPQLGLDLQGGISITQQPVGAFETEQLDVAVERIRERIDSLGVAEPEIIRQGDAIVVNLPGVKNQQEAIALVQVTGQVYLRPVIGCINEGVEEPATTTTSATDSSSTQPGSSTTTGSSTVSTSTPTTAAGATPSSANGFGRQSRWGAAPTTTGSTSTTGPTPTTVPGASTTTDPGATTTTVASTSGVVSDPNIQQILPLKGGGQCYVGPSGGTGEVFQGDAAANIIQGGWGVDVSLRGGAAGVDVWNALATQCFNGQGDCSSRRLAIELDGLIVSAPTVNEPRFSDRVSITGSFNERDARDLARVLRSGSLPLRLETQSVQTVSPTLGKDSLRAAVVSGIVGVLLVLAFMILYYRLLGVVVAGGLIVTGGLLWSVIAILSETSGLTLSLSGVAGVIISVGVTVDSYVVFFERLKDEARSGRTMRNSAQRGFTTSWHTILVADLISLMGAAVLWYLTVGSVRNFAFFLGLSTACDLVVHYFFTRPAVLLAARTKWMARRKVMGIEAGQDRSGPAAATGARV